MALIRRTGAWAFTLLELITAIVIIGVVIAIAVPAIGSVRARAHAATCMSNLHQIGAALGGYLADHDQQMPVLLAGRSGKGSDDDAVIDVVLADYAEDPHVFACPADPRYFRETGTSYYWNVTLNGQRTTSLNFLGIEDAHTRIPVISDKEGWHPGDRTKINILYADGHAGRGLKLSTGN